MFSVDCLKCKLVYIWCSSEHLSQIYGRRRAAASVDSASASNKIPLGSSGKENEVMLLVVKDQHNFWLYHRGLLFASYFLPMVTKVPYI